MIPPGNELSDAALGLLVAKSLGWEIRQVSSFCWDFDLRGEDAWIPVSLPSFHEKWKEDTAECALEFLWTLNSKQLPCWPRNLDAAVLLLKGFRWRIEHTEDQYGLPGYEGMTDLCQILELNHIRGLGVSITPARAVCLAYVAKGIKDGSVF